MNVTVVILNYRTPRLVIDCLDSLSTELETVGAKLRIVVVDNCSGDESVELIQGHLQSELGAAGWKRNVMLIQSPVNGGYASGNNLGIAAAPGDFYWLLNSDTRVRPGALRALLLAAAEHPHAALIGPRIEHADGSPQISCFRFISPVSEFLTAANTSVLDRLLRRFVVPVAAPDVRQECDWISFASVLVRDDAMRRHGSMDERYFMYFEDTDYCRFLRCHGWFSLHEPAARVVHLKGGSSTVEADLAAKRRPPAYYYAARSRYFRKWYGPAGLCIANLAWVSGRAISHVRRLFGKPLPPICEAQVSDQWLNWRDPLGKRG